MKERIIVDPELKNKYIVYESSRIVNMETGKAIKPYKDKRRPNECPAIYLKRKDGTRRFWYHDELMASLFIENYDGNSFIHHIDGNVANCELSNRLIDDGVSILKTIHHETLEWRKLCIETKLYYDYYICEDGRLYNASTDSFISPFKDSRNGGYLRYTLYYGKSINETIHVSTSRLVALHYVPQPEGKSVVIFIDGNCENTHRSNLTWGDRWDVVNRKYMFSREFGLLNVDFLGKEKWEPLIIDGVTFGYEYMISNYGRIWNDTKKFYPIPQRDSHPNPNNQCHMLINLLTKDGYKDFMVHRLVAHIFVPNKDPDRDIVVNHINGNPECNWAINLEWCTMYENVHHSINSNLYHSNKFDGRVHDPDWRMNTIMAWIYSMKNMTDEVAYNFYCEYNSRYNDNIPEVGFREFVDTFNDKISNDSDFIKLYNFYKSYK